MKVILDILKVRIGNMRVSKVRIVNMKASEARTRNRKVLKLRIMKFRKYQREEL